VLQGALKSLGLFSLSGFPRLETVSRAPLRTIIPCRVNATLTTLAGHLKAAIGS
jgi:hypothetical protein